MYTSSRGKIDFSRCSSDRMVSMAATYGWVLRDVFHEKVYRGAIHLEGFSSTGQPLVYNGPHDFRNARLRDIVTSIIPPRAHDLSLAARGQPCEDSVRHWIGGDPIIDWLVSGEVYEPIPEVPPPLKGIRLAKAHCRMAFRFGMAA